MCFFQEGKIANRHPLCYNKCGFSGKVNTIYKEGFVGKIRIKRKKGYLCT